MLNVVPPQGKLRSAQFQRSLFPKSDSRSFLFVELPLRSGKEFLQIVENACPRVVVDLRNLPTFNFDLLSREKVFGVFAKSNSVYIDCELPMEQEANRESWDVLFTRHSFLTALKEGKGSGPYMFLFSRGGEVPRFENFLRDAMSQIRGDSWSVFHITYDEEFALKRFKV